MKLHRPGFGKSQAVSGLLVSEFILCYLLDPDSRDSSVSSLMACFCVDLAPLEKPALLCTLSI